MATRTSTPFCSVADLPVDRHAAEHDRTGELEEAAVGAEAFLDLAGQFAGRRQHERAAGARIGAAGVKRQAIEDRQGEGGGLAGAGLGDAEKVAAGEDRRDGFRLDGGGGFVRFGGERLEDGHGEAELSKIGQVFSFLSVVDRVRGRATGGRGCAKRRGLDPA